jgi:hypothetical protein
MLSHSSPRTVRGRNRLATLAIILSCCCRLAAAETASLDRLKCDADYDVVFVPFSPISQTDRFEVRVQLRATTGTLPLTVEVFLDAARPETKAISKRITVVADKFQLLKCFPDVRGKTCGPHEVLVRFTAEDGETREVRKAFELRNSVPNLLEGAFISFGASMNRIPATTFADVRLLSEEQWQSEMDALAELGFKVIIPQGAIQLDDFDALRRPGGPKESDFSAYYPSQYYPHARIAARDPIRVVLERAERNGQIVFLPYGNIYCDVARRLDVMQELFERYGKYKSFYGWYEPIEWFYRGSHRPLERARGKADELCPAKPVLFSPSGGEPNGMRDGIYRLLASGGLKADILMPMDSVGSRRGRPGQLMYNARLFSALKAALASTDVHLWGNCESFDFSAADQLVPRFRNGGFDGAAGFVQQMETVQPYVEKMLTWQATALFVKPGSPGSEIKLCGKEGIEQYRQYKDYLRSPRPVYRNLALGKPYVKSRKPDLPAAEDGADPDQQYLSTDGYLAGGTAGDVARMFGYSTLQDSVEVAVDFDLQAATSIDRVRVAGSPTYKNDPEDHSPDKIVVSIGADPSGLKSVAVLTAYVHGWAECKLPQGTVARCVRLVLSRQKQPRQEEVKMFVNEIEIGQIVK